MLRQLTAKSMTPHILRRFAALLLLTATLAPWGVAQAGDPAPDEISVFGEYVKSESQWPSSTAWGISYRKILAPYFAASLAYLNDGHFPGHHRDGVTAEAWLPINLFHDHITISAGVGPFYYYDTVVAQKSNAGYAD